MTGLTADTDHILEMACLITDSQLNVVAEVRSIVSAGKHLSKTNLSDLSIVGTRDIFVYRQRHQIKSCDSPDRSIPTCYQSASSRVTRNHFFTQKCFSVENIIIVSLTIVIPITVNV